MSYKKTFGRIVDFSCKSLCINDKSVISRTADGFFNNLTVSGELQAQNSMTVKGNAVVCGDLEIKGRIMAAGGEVGSGFMFGNITMEGLVGFWFVGPESPVPGVNLALFDGETGLMKSGEIEPIPGRISESKQQWGRGDQPGTLASFFITDYTDSAWRLSKYDCHTKDTTWLDVSPQFSAGTFDGVPVQFDPTMGLYVCADVVSSTVRIKTVHPMTGTVFDLSAANGGSYGPNPSGDLLAMELIADKVVVADRATWFYIFDRATGQYENRFRATPTNIIYPGGNPLLGTTYESVVFGLAMDRDNVRLHMIWGEAGSYAPRLLGYIQGTTEADIVAAIQADNYTLTCAKYPQRQFLNSLAWVPTT